MPNVWENADETGFDVRISVGQFRFVWCKAPFCTTGAQSDLKDIWCFYPGSGDGSAALFEDQSLVNNAFVVQMAKQKKEEQDVVRLRREIEDAEERHQDPNMKGLRKGLSSEIEKLKMQLKVLEERQELWHMHVKASPFRAIYNYPVVSELKALMTLAAPPHKPPFDADPNSIEHELKMLRYFKEVEQRGNGLFARREWKSRFNIASGSEFRVGLKAAHWNFEFDWADDTHMVRVRHYMQGKSYVIEHMDLPPQKNKVVRWPAGGLFSWEAYWPQEPVRNSSGALKPLQLCSALLEPARAVGQIGRRSVIKEVDIDGAAQDVAELSHVEGDTTEGSLPHDSAPSEAQAAGAANCTGCSCICGSENKAVTPSVELVGFTSSRTEAEPDELLPDHEAACTNERQPFHTNAGPGDGWSMAVTDFSKPEIIPANPTNPWVRTFAASMQVATYMKKGKPHYEEVDRVLGFPTPRKGKGQKKQSASEHAIKHEEAVQL